MGLETAMSSGLRPSRVRYLVLAAACCLALLTYVNRLGFGVAASEIKGGLGLSDEQMGYLASAFLVAYGIFQIPGGLLGDRIGGRRLLTVLVVCWSLLSGATALGAAFPTAAAEDDRCCTGSGLPGNQKRNPVGRRNSTNRWM